ncbi:MAG: hypothetical protein IKK37_02865 [Clostridia bacterium]|nr:hypothetical protein [Clostridia bacterium]
MKKIKRIIAILLTATILFGTCIIASAADEGTANNTEVVARMYLCHKASTDHTWIYIENLSSKSIQVGAYPYMVPKGSGVSVGTYGTTVEDGPGLYYNFEAWRYRYLDPVNNPDHKFVYLYKDLTADDLVKVNNMIVNSNRWSKILNCAYTALRIWNKIPGQKVIYLYFPFLIELQLAFKGAINNIDGDLKMIVPTLNQTYKQIDLGDSVTTQLSNPTPIGEPSNGDE